MKKNLSLLFILLAFSLSAKKVKFAVDMTSYTISPNGIHVMGDFQAVAGYTADWSPSETVLIQEGTSGIYSIVLNLPAFQKYEFKFVNGDQSYEAEFVPDEARVGYGFNDNRWIYVDSLANDTTFMGAVKFSENSPAGKFLIRYKVDMSTAGSVSPDGVHVGTSYQSFDPSKIRLYSFGSGIYEIINYVPSGNYSFLYYNGNTAGTAETVPGACSSGGNRITGLPKDTILPTVCFSSCSACVVGLKESLAQETVFRMFPNPAENLVTINALSIAAVQVFDVRGKLLITQTKFSGESHLLDISELPQGVYNVRVINTSGKSQTQKLVKN